MSIIVIDHDRLLRKRDERQEEVDSLVPFLGCKVEIVEGTTLENIFNFIALDSHLLGTIFGQELGFHDLDQYIEQMNKPGDFEDEEPLVKLVISFGAEIMDGEIVIGSDLSGVRIGKNEAGVVGEMYCAVEFTPINNLKHLPVVIEQDFPISDFDHPEKFDFWNGKRLHSTLWEFLGAILFEISFLGNVQDQLKKIGELDQLIADAKQQLKEGKLHRLNFEDFEI